MSKTSTYGTCKFSFKKLKKLTSNPSGHMVLHDATFNVTAEIGHLDCLVFFKKLCKLVH